MPAKGNLFIVILYDKKLSESKTLQSFLPRTDPTDSLVIVNNGPQGIDWQDPLLDFIRIKFDKVIIQEFLENKPLSHVYNEVINDFQGYKNYIIFDDDSEFDINDLLLYLAKSKQDLILPSIIAGDGNKYYPKANGIVIQGEACDLNQSESVMSISSGMMLSHQLINKFHRQGLPLFDPRFALYGIDTCFFKNIARLKELGIPITISNKGTITHSLSRVESNKLTAFRFRERMIDRILTVKFYPEKEKSKIETFFRLLVKSLCRGDMKALILLVQVFYTGRHPRCNK